MKINKKYRFYKAYLQNGILLLFIMIATIFLSFLSEVFMIGFGIFSFICFIIICAYISKLVKAYRITQYPRSEGVIEHVEITGYKYTFHIKYIEDDKEKHIISIPFVLNRITFDFTISKVQKECLNKKVTFIIDENQVYMMDIME